MTDADLVRAIEMAEALAESAGDLHNERTKALQSYLGDNTNPAPEGRSQIVDRSVFDTVESIKPNILKIFLAGDEIVKFNPRGPEDAAQADQETAYVNHLILDKNDAFTLLGTALHDGLVQKTGYAKAYWEEREDVVKEHYDDLTDDEFALLAKDSDVEIVEHEEEEYPQTDAMGMPLGAIRAHSVTLQRKKQYGCLKFVNIAPENVLVDHNANRVSVKNCDFVEHREKKSISQLRAEGFDVADDIQDTGSGSQDWEDDVRDKFSPFRDMEAGEEPDPSMRRVWVREVWMRVDADGDGMAELRHIIVVGTKVLENEEVEFIPISAFCPYPMPHQHYGLSVYDICKEVEQTKTSLTRASLDNVYLAVNGRHAVDPARVNMDDMLQSRPGGIVRVDGDISSAIMPLTSPQTHSVALEMNEYMDVVRETRTGVTRYNQGLDANSLNKTATGISLIQGSTKERELMVARQFAEFVKELFSDGHALTLKHSRQKEIVLLRNQWIPVDPRQWTKRTDLSISVGLGNGNKQEQSMFLNQMLAFAVGPGLQIGVTSPPKLYNMLGKVSNAAGFRNPDEFWDNPANQPPKPPPPNPEMVKVQQQGQLEQAKLQASAQADAQKMQTTAQIEQQKIAATQDLERYKAQMQIELEQWKAQLQAQTQIQIAQINAQVQASRPVTNGS